jgi:short-subunit dehydrogenase
LRDQAVDAETFPADLIIEKQRFELFRFVRERLDGLDILVNNAGIGSFGHFASSSEQILRTVMEANFFVPAEMIRLAMPLLKCGCDPLIINVASKCGRRALPAWPEYSASKFGLCGLTEALRAEFSRFGIDILLVLPGLTATGMGRKLLRRDGRMNIDFASGVSPDYVARKILEAAALRRIEITLGWDARALLMVNRFFPRLLDRLIARKVVALYS